MRPINLHYCNQDLSNIKRQLYLGSDTVCYYFSDDDTIKVEDNSYVLKNQLLIEKNNGIKVYASVSGNISLKNNVIFITNDYNECDIRKKSMVKDIKQLKNKKILSRVKELGLEYDEKTLYEVLDSNNEVLVLNTIDYDLYQFNEKYTFLENVINILETVDLIRKEFNMLVYVVVDSKDRQVMDVIDKVFSNFPLIEFIYFEESFPYNYNQLLYEKYLNIYDYEKILFLNVITTYKLFLALKYNTLLNERYITIWGNVSQTILVIKAKYGTSLDTIIKNYYPHNKRYNYCINNVFRKFFVNDISLLRVNDNVKSIYINKDEIVRACNCINCGLCHKICPVGINPQDKKDINWDKCIKCGLCNYVCPANISLISMEGIHE